MRTFRAMNTDVTVAAPRLDDAAEQQLAEKVAALFAETERRSAAEGRPGKRRG